MKTNVTQRKTILITGASSGIGKATAKLFGGNGWNVIASMRKPDGEDELNKLDNVLVAKRKAEDDATFLQGMRNQFAL